MLWLARNRVCVWWWWRQNSQWQTAADLYPNPEEFLPYFLFLNSLNVSERKKVISGIG